MEMEIGTKRNVVQRRLYSLSIIELVKMQFMFVFVVIDDECVYVWPSAHTPRRMLNFTVHSEV